MVIWDEGWQPCEDFEPYRGERGLAMQHKCACGQRMIWCLSCHAYHHQYGWQECGEIEAIDERAHEAKKQLIATGESP